MSANRKNIFCYTEMYVFIPTVKIQARVTCMFNIHDDTMLHMH